MEAYTVGRSHFGLDVVAFYQQRVVFRAGDFSLVRVFGCIAEADVTLLACFGADFVHRHDEDVAQVSTAGTVQVGLLKTDEDAVRIVVA